MFTERRKREIGDIDVDEVDGARGMVCTGGKEQDQDKDDQNIKLVQAEHGEGEGGLEDEDDIVQRWVTMMEIEGSAT